MLGDDELNSIKKIFESNWIGKGNSVKEFEQNFAFNLNADPKNILSTTSCTEAIFLAADLYDFTQFDEIIVPSISFPSIGSSIMVKNAKIVFCDVDPHTLNVRKIDIEHLINDSTKAIFITHYGGFPVDLDPIIELCKNRNIKIIEDSACAIKSFYKGKACGTIGDMGMWSLDSMKTLSTGDGGMIHFKNLNDKYRAEEMLYLGLPVKQKSGLDSSTDGSNNWWEFQMNYPGRRAIMNNITAAIGIEQNKKLTQFIEKRKNIFNYYYSELSQLDWLKCPELPNFDYTSSYYFFWLQLSERDKLARYLLEKKIYTTFRYWPLHNIDIFKKYVNRPLPNSDYASKKTLNIPLHQALTDNDVEYIVKVIKNFK